LAAVFPTVRVSPRTWALLRYAGTEAESSLRNAAQMLLAELADELRSRLKLDVECIIDTGAAHRVIGNAMEAIQPDLLVVGAHGKGMVQQLWLGGTASKLLTQSAQALLVVRLPWRPGFQPLAVGRLARRVNRTVVSLAVIAAVVLVV